MTKETKVVINDLKPGLEYWFVVNSIGQDRSTISKESAMLTAITSKIKFYYISK